MMLLTLSVSAQSSVAEEVIRVEASSATVHQWFDRIEREGRVVLAYNPSMIEMSRPVALTVSGRMTVRQLLSYLLAGYDYRIESMPGRKILIQVAGKTERTGKGEGQAARNGTLPPGERTVEVAAGTASLRQWLDAIQQQAGITLLFAPSELDMKRQTSFRAGGAITVRKLLGILLKDYVYSLETLSADRLRIAVDHPLRFDITGTVREAESNEKLLGATVTVIDCNGHSNHAVTDRNGFFNVAVCGGSCTLTISYVGYASYTERFDIAGDRLLSVRLAPLPYEIKTVQVQRRKSMEEMDEVAPSNLVSFSNADLFSQIRILPGVSSAVPNMNFNVAGGSADENLFLLEGFPVYNPGHINSMLTLFNGDALKSVSFYNSFIPTQYEGRLSSVTDVHLREGNKRDFASTLSLDMPSASVVLEGPIVRDKVSCLVSGRRSWFDLFGNMISDEDFTNHTFYDFNAKLSCDLDSVTSLEVSGYNSCDDYHVSDNGRKETMLHWNNQLFSLHFSTLVSSKVANTTSLAFGRHTNRANADTFGMDSVGILRSRIRSVYANTEFSYSPGSLYTMRWGMKGVFEKYGLAAFGMSLPNEWEPVKQLSLFYDNRLRIFPWLYAQVGVNYVFYVPTNYRRFSSVQPRFSLKFAAGGNDLLHFTFSRMEQFYHHIRLLDVSTPFDFMMPSIAGFKPSTATHCELGWKHFSRQGILELSAYYKRRNNVLALRPDVYIEDSEWAKYIMVGRGDSYGASLYYYDGWKRLKWQLSYTISKSREWFDYLPDRRRVPSLYDVPHVFNGVVSCEVGRHSLLTLGGNLHSGKVLMDVVDESDESFSTFRSQRDPLRYRVDASYTFRKEFRRSKLLLRVGLYNILGNPPEDEMSFYFSFKIKNHCMPFGTVSFKF